jgi:hypothetical protein
MFRTIHSRSILSSSKIPRKGRDWMAARIELSANGNGGLGSAIEGDVVDGGHMQRRERRKSLAREE